MKIRPYSMDWVSSTDPKNRHKLKELQIRMEEYYSNRPEYYSKEISTSEDLWNDKNNLCYQYIINATQSADKILELGCGKSSLLKWQPELEGKYTGIEFSESLIHQNSLKYPRADFVLAKDSRYPIADNSFDLIFSVFVIEHTVFPHLFLDECLRLLKPGGKVIILAPNYLDYLWMPSQQVASSLESGSVSLKKGKFGDALSSFLYNKIFIPQRLKRINPSHHQFWINLRPLCFQIKDFRSDVDAVYITSEDEINSYLNRKGIVIHDQSDVLKQFCQARRYLFVHGNKV